MCLQQWLILIFQSVLKVLFTNVATPTDWRADWPLSVASFVLFMIEAAACDFIMVRSCRHSRTVWLSLVSANRYIDYGLFGIINILSSHSQQLHSSSL